MPATTGCARSMGRLKEPVRACRQHNQRVQLAVSLQGIKIRDGKTGELVFHYPVPQISFIWQDTSGARAAGYTYVAQDESYRYIAIKTDKEAMQQ
ncbi:hypothetical protein V5799_022116 [Amblyomma americanum]|uniref:PID domain-containing protein n=1 Tax=Amblyomma americanum TaxID=6943 RepID=A0AAQ4FNH3_AMBAM